MKKLVFASLALVSLSASAVDLQFQNLSKKQVEDVGQEFAVNFSHTAVAAPETDGLWGVEVGLVGGSAPTPELEKTVDSSGGDGSEFKNLYHAGLMLRGHGPFDLFAELSILPEREISDVTIENRTFGFGWNAGGYFNLPLDLALGVNFSSTTLSFDQTISNVPSTVDVDAKSRVVWLGVSKTFLFFTPYAKAGLAKTEADIDSTAAIFGYTSQTSENVSSSGAYLAAGANVEFFFVRLGVEYSKTIDVTRVSGKFSLSF